MNRRLEGDRLDTDDRFLPYWTFVAIGPDQDVSAFFLRNGSRIVGNPDNSSDAQGDLMKATKDFVVAVKAKALDIWRRAPTLVVVSGIGILVLCSSCCICTGVASLLFKSPDGSTESSRGVRTPAVQVPDLRKELLDTARRMDGDFVEVVADIVDAVETGDQPWSVADKRMYEFRPGYHQFSSETIAAYERWKAARISAERE